MKSRKSLPIFRLLWLFLAHLFQEFLLLTHLELTPLLTVWRAHDNKLPVVITENDWWSVTHFRTLFKTHFSKRGTILPFDVVVIFLYSFFLFLIFPLTVAILCCYERFEKQRLSNYSSCCIAKFQLQLNCLLILFLKRTNDWTLNSQKYL